MHPIYRRQKDITPTLRSSPNQSRHCGRHCAMNRWFHCSICHTSIYQYAIDTNTYGWLHGYLCLMQRKQILSEKSRHTLRFAASHSATHAGYWICAHTPRYIVFTTDHFLTNVQMRIAPASSHQKQAKHKHHAEQNAHKKEMEKRIHQQQKQLKKQEEQLQQQQLEQEALEQQIEQQQQQKYPQMEVIWTHSEIIKELMRVLGPISIWSRLHASHSCYLFGRAYISTSIACT